VALGPVAGRFVVQDRRLRYGARVLVRGPQGVGSHAGAPLVREQGAGLAVERDGYRAGRRPRRDAAAGVEPLDLLARDARESR